MNDTTVLISFRQLLVPNYSGFQSDRHVQIAWWLGVNPSERENETRSGRKVGLNLKPGTVCVCGMKGLRKDMHTIKHPPSPASRTGADLPTNVQAVSRAVSYVNTHHPRFQIRARPIYLSNANLLIALT